MAKASSTRSDLIKRHGPATVKHYIALRGGGMTRAAACREIGITYPTGTSWDGKFAERIERIRDERYEAMVAQYRLGEGDRLGEISALARRILDELRNRDLADVKTDKLAEMGLQLLGEVDKIMGVKNAAEETDFAKIMQQINVQVNTAPVEQQ